MNSTSNKSYCDNGSDSEYIPSDEESFQDDDNIDFTEVTTEMLDLDYVVITTQRKSKPVRYFHNEKKHLPASMGGARGSRNNKNCPKQAGSLDMYDSNYNGNKKK